MGTARDTDALEMLAPNGATITSLTIANDDDAFFDGDHLDRRTPLVGPMAASLLQINRRGTGTSSGTNSHQPSGRSSLCRVGNMRR